MILYCVSLLLLALIVVFSKNLNIKYVIIWLIVITSVAAIYGLYNELLNSELVTVSFPSKGYAAKDGSLEFKQASNGHFYIQAEINQKNITFLLDTGSTDTVLSLKDAQKIGINLKEIRDFKRYQTANGTVLAGSVKIPKIRIGDFVVKDVRISINTYPMSISLLGMNLLKHFNFTVKDDRLIIYYDQKIK